MATKYIPLDEAEYFVEPEKMELELRGMTVRGLLYDGIRIEKHTVPKGTYAFGIRHNDDNGDPATISPDYPAVNFYGTFITYDPNAELIASETAIKDWNFSLT